MAYQFAQYSPGFKSQLADLRSRVFSGTPEFNLAYLEWKYERNPYLDGPIFYLALADGRVVGMRGVYGSQWQFGTAAPIIVPTAAEFAVDREHRGRYLAQQLESMADEDLATRRFAYSLNVSPTLATRLLRMRAGWKRAAVYQTYRRGKFPDSVAQAGKALRQRSPLHRVARRARTFLAELTPEVSFKRFDNWAAQRHEAVAPTAVPRIPLMSELVSKYGDASRFRHVRDPQFYEWRLKDPRSQYRFLYDEQKSGCEGFFTLQQFPGGGVASIVDWAVSGPEVWTGLLDAVVTSGIAQLQIASTTFSDGQLKALRTHGFEQVVEEDTRSHPAPGLFVRALAVPDADDWMLEGQQLLDAERWDMRMIYSDAF